MAYPKILCLVGNKKCLANYSVYQQPSKMTHHHKQYLYRTKTRQKAYAIFVGSANTCLIDLISCYLYTVSKLY